MRRLILASAFLTSCASPHSISHSNKVYQGVVVTNGISRMDATQIAQNYFDTFVGCGSFSGIANAGSKWKVDGYFGYAGAPIEGFYISKDTGDITSTIGPSFVGLKQVSPK